MVQKGDITCETTRDVSGTTGSYQAQGLIRVIKIRTKAPGAIAPGVFIG